MKRCIHDDKLESEIAAWNKRAQMTPEQDIEKEEPAPVEWQAETQEFVVNWCQVIIRTQWMEHDDHGSEVTVMFDAKMDSNHHTTLLESAALPIRAADPCG